MMILKPFRLTLKLNGTECIKPLTGEMYTNACCDHDDHDDHGHVYNDDDHVYYDDDHVYYDDDHVYDDDHDHDYGDHVYDDHDHADHYGGETKGHLNHQFKESDKVVGDWEQEDDDDENPPLGCVQRLEYKIQFCCHIRNTKIQDNNQQNGLGYKIKSQNMFVMFFGKWPGWLLTNKYSTVFSRCLTSTQKITRNRRIK